MKIKSLFLGSIALFAMPNVQAGDIVVVDEPAAAVPANRSYVRVCDGYGEGYFYIPGTESCIRLSGNVRLDGKGGQVVDATAAEYRDGKLRRDSIALLSRTTLQAGIISQTDLGTVRSFFELNADWVGDSESAQIGDRYAALQKAYFEIGGIRTGLDDSIFNYWTDNYGSVIEDALLNIVPSIRTIGISYTLSGNNGFSAIVGAEQGSSGGVTGYRYNREKKVIDSDYFSYHINGYIPNIVAGVKYAQGWGNLSAITAYDSSNKTWAGKVRVDTNLSEDFSLWLMSGYKTQKDYYTENHNGKGVYRVASSLYGDWGGSWIGWGGGTYRFTPQVDLNMQASYEAVKSFAAVVNVGYEVIPSWRITPEVAYISWRDQYSYRESSGGTVSTALNGKNAVQGMIRLQHSF